MFWPNSCEYNKQQQFLHSINFQIKMFQYVPLDFQWSKGIFNDYFLWVHITNIFVFISINCIMGLLIFFVSMVELGMLHH